MKISKKVFILIGLVAITALFALPANATTHKYEITNNTGVAASDLHVTFSGSGGFLTVVILADPAGCPAGAASTNTNEMIIDWGVACVAPGSSVIVKVSTPNGPLAFAGGYWTDPANQGSPGIGPVNGGDVAEIFVGDKHYSDLNPNVPDLDPSYPWLEPPWNDFPVPVPVPMVGGDEIAFGMDNLTVKENIKYLYIKVSYTGAGQLDLEATGSGWVFARGGPEVTVDNRPAGENAPGYITVTIVYDPQPEWEWLLFKATDGLTITDVVFEATCFPMAYPSGIPSLTEWGMIALVVLILAAGAMVIIRRRRAASVVV